MKCQKNKCLILHVFTAKKPIWPTWWNLGMVVIAWKQLISAEGSILRKCRQLLGLNFRIGDWLLWLCFLLVFCWLKVKMWFFCFLDQNVLHNAQQNCIKRIKILILVMVEGIGGRWYLSYWTNFPVLCMGTIGARSQKFEKSETINFFQMILKYFWTLWILLESSRVKRMLREIGV